MEASEFIITKGAFIGPISLLQELVEKRKVFINDISLADVADEFIQIIQSKREDGSRLTEEASFVQVAATLLLLKSKSLLPHFVVTPEEEESVLELARRFEIFERVRAQASVLNSIYGKQIYLDRIVSPSEEESYFTPDERLTSNYLHTILKRVRENLPQKTMPERVSVKQTVRLEDILEDLTKRIKKQISVSFSEFARVGESSKGEMVVYFVALLELIKQGFLEAKQQEQNGDIEMKYKEIAVPNYS